MGVLAGILSGLIAGVLYNRYKDIKLPTYLAFFGGRRFVPIATGFAMLLLGVVLLLLRRGIRQTLQPLQQLSATVDRREVNDLAPLSLVGIPGEITPLVGAINGLLGRVADATSEQQLFLSGAAHQLRTPLAGMQTQIELAAQEAPPRVRERLARVHDAMDRMSHCTQQMLALARASAQASSEQDQGQVALTELLEDAASNWLDLALKRQVELEFEIEPASCDGSRWMLQEMLGNLIDNAIQYSPPGARVSVRCGLDTAARPGWKSRTRDRASPSPSASACSSPSFALNRPAAQALAWALRS